MNAKYKPTGKMIKWSRLVLMVALLLAAAIAAAYQSNDRISPTPLKSNLIKGAGTGKKVEYYYSFTAGQGEVSVTVDLKATSGSTGAEIEIFNRDGAKIFYYYPNAISTTERTAKSFVNPSRQLLILRLQFDRSAGDYQIKLGGAVELAQTTQCGAVLPDGVGVNASCVPHITNIEKFLETCPGSDPATSTILSDFEIRRENVKASFIPCTQPISKLPLKDYTDQLILLQALRVIYYMDRGMSGHLPWTKGTVYDWLKAKVHGFNITDQETAAARCCGQIDGKLFVTMKPLGNDDFNRDRRRVWIGLQGLVALIGHERRHADGIGHVTCKGSDNMDQSYDEKNLSAFGVQWWLTRAWLNGTINIGLGCLAKEKIDEIAEWHLSEAKGWREGRFCDSLPPVLTKPALVGGKCNEVQSPLTVNDSSPTGLPDLVVVRISFEPSPSQIRVLVGNAGDGASTSCYLALQSLAGDDSSLGTKQRVWSVKVPSLDPRKGFTEVIDVSPLTQANGPWRATVDRSNTVKESNESNNSLIFPPNSAGKRESR